MPLPRLPFKKSFNTALKVAVFLSGNYLTIPLSFAESQKHPCDTENISASNTKEPPVLVSSRLTIADQKLSELRARQLELDNKIMFPVFGDGHQLQALLFWQDITNKAIFTTPKIEQITQQLAILHTAVNTNHCQHIGIQAQQLQQEATLQLDNFKAAQWLYDAQKATKDARADLMMYRMMKYVQGPAPALQQAQTLYAEAETEMSQGNLALALIKWQQAAKSYNEDAFQEVINGFKNNGDDAAEFAKKQLQEIREKVAQQLSEYFVSIPAGELMMGNDAGNSDEKPPHLVKLETFKLGKFEITFDLWDLCTEVRMCLHNPDDDGWGRKDYPVIHVSHNDITEQFIPWLTFMTGKQYRLPTEAQWEYAARANTSTTYPWGDEINCSDARFNGGFGSECPAQNNGVNRGTSAVKSYAPNKFGLYDMQGNVWEWVQDCYSNAYPIDKTINPSEYGQCDIAVLRGGSWKDKKDHLRTTNRFYFAKNVRSNNFGFRLVELGN